MLIPEISSFFALAFVIGLGLVSNYFLHRLELSVLTLSEEVSKKLEVLSLKFF